MYSDFTSRSGPSTFLAKKKMFLILMACEFGLISGLKKGSFFKQFREKNLKNIPAGPNHGCTP